MSNTSKITALTLAAILVSGCAGNVPSNEGQKNAGKAGSFVVSKHDPDTVVRVPPAYADPRPLNCRERKHQWKNGVCHLNDSSEPTVRNFNDYLSTAWGPVTEPRIPTLPKEPCIGNDCEGVNPADYPREYREKHFPDYERENRAKIEELKERATDRLKEINREMEAEIERLERKREGEVEA